MLILDTHIWVHLVEGDLKIEKNGLIKKIKGEDLAISSISLWEVAMLHSKNRLKLNINLGDWLRRYSNLPSLKPLEISPSIAALSAELPDDYLLDPADRLIIATAQSLNATIVSFDKEIIKFAKLRGLKILSN